MRTARFRFTPAALATVLVSGALIALPVTSAQAADATLSANAWTPDLGNGVYAKTVAVSAVGGSGGMCMIVPGGAGANYLGVLAVDPTSELTAVPGTKGTDCDGSLTGTAGGTGTYPGAPGGDGSTKGTGLGSGGAGGGASTVVSLDGSEIVIAGGGGGAGGFVPAAPPDALLGGIGGSGGASGNSGAIGNASGSANPGTPGAAGVVGNPVDVRATAITGESAVTGPGNNAGGGGAGGSSAGTNAAAAGAGVTSQSTNSASGGGGAGGGVWSLGLSNETIDTAPVAGDGQAKVFFVNITGGSIADTEVGSSFTGTDFAVDVDSSSPSWSLEAGTTAVPDGLEIDSSTGAISGTATTAGTYSFHVVATATVSGKSLTSYQEVDVTVSNTLTPQTIDFPQPPSTAINAGPVALTATASSGLAVSYTSTTTSVCAVSGSSVTLLTTGTCSITASQDGDSTYSSATPVSKSFDVTLVPQTIDFPQPPSTAINAGPVVLTATASSNLAVSYTSTTTSVCTVSGSSVTLLMPGTCSITASQDGGSMYAAATPVSKSFAVTLTPQTITFARPADTALSSGTVALTASASSGLTVTFASDTAAVCTVSGSTVTLLTGGTCTITASQTGDSTYDPATPVSRSFEVTLAAQTINFPQPPETTVEAGTVALQATASSGLAVSYTSNSTSVCTVAGNTVSLLAAGDCTITAQQPGNATYAAASPVQRTFKVSASGESKPGPVKQLHITRAPRAKVRVLSWGAPRTGGPVTAYRVMIKQRGTGKWLIIRNLSPNTLSTKIRKAALLRAVHQTRGDVRPKAYSFIARVLAVNESGKSRQQSITFVVRP